MSITTLNDYKFYKKELEDIGIQILFSLINIMSFFKLKFNSFMLIKYGDRSDNTTFIVA
jgi:hypothetical protein